MGDIHADVAIVGYGPVGRMLAVVLAEQGHSVVVVERQKDCYPLPRAVCMDHEIFRAMHAHGCAQDIGSYSEPSPRYQWFGQKWEQLLDIDWTVESVSGGPEAHFFYQPALEAALERRLKHFSSVTVLTQHEARSFIQDAEGVDLQVEDCEEGHVRLVRARYLIGADGANSMVRRSIGAAWEDLGFNADFLVVDLAINPGVKLAIPSAGQFCNTERPTTFVPGGIKDGLTIRRWEFRLKATETRCDFEDEEAVWPLLEQWVRPEQGQILRHAIYTFRSLVASQWRTDRVFLAGDAAHLTPPFLGQGMCSGIRDAINLGWRLSLVLHGATSEALLNSYELERKPHIKRLIEIAMYLGKIICVDDPAEAAERDQDFLSGAAPPPPEMPFLTEGTRDPKSSIAGRLSPHASVLVEGKSIRLDEHTGPEFALVVRNCDAVKNLPQRCIELLRRLRVQLVLLTATRDVGRGAIVDQTGKLMRFLDENEIDGYLSRPDGYLFGAIPKGASAQSLLDSLDELAPGKDWNCCANTRQDAPTHSAKRIEKYLSSSNTHTSTT